MLTLATNQPGAVSAPAPVTHVNLLPWKQVTCSPDEEASIRCQLYGAPEPAPDYIAAGFLTTSRVVTIYAEGIKFQLNNKPHHFWEEHTITIRDEFLGQQRTIRYDPDNLVCIHVFDDKGRYVETIARYTAPHMLDRDAQAKVLAATKRQVKALLAEHGELHKADTRAAVKREIANRDRIQRVRQFPVPNNSATADHRTNAAAHETVEASDFKEEAPQPRFDAPPLSANLNADADRESPSGHAAPRAAACLRSDPPETASPDAVSSSRLPGVAGSQTGASQAIDDSAEHRRVASRSNFKEAETLAAATRRAEQIVKDAPQRAASASARRLKFRQLMTT